MTNVEKEVEKAMQKMYKRQMIKSIVGLVGGITGGLTAVTLFGDPITGWRVGSSTATSIASGAVVIMSAFGGQALCEGIVEHVYIAIDTHADKVAAAKAGHQTIDVEAEPAN